MLNQHQPPSDAGQPSGAPMWGRRPLPQRERRPARTGLYLVLGLVVVVVAVALLVVAGRGDGDDPPGKPPVHEQTSPSVSGARADVEITRCSVSASTEWPQATLRITNYSSKTSDYWINVEFLDAKGERIAEGATASSNLASKQVANEIVTGFTSVSGQVVCRITQVTRLAS